MTVIQARDNLVMALRNMRSYHYSIGDVTITREKVYFEAKTEKASNNYILSFADLGDMSVESGSWIWSHPNEPSAYVLSNAKPLTIGDMRVDFYSESRAFSFVDAVLVLKKLALTPNTEEADFAAFANEAKAWLLMTPKPTMTDDTLAQKGLAEEAFKRKDYAAALVAYTNAISKYAMWPEGHYNAALLAAEAKDFELASKHMRRYLALAPGANDAAAAKEKFLVWQLKAKQFVYARGKNTPQD